MVPLPFSCTFRLSTVKASSVALDSVPVRGSYDLDSDDGLGDEFMPVTQKCSPARMIVCMRVFVCVCVCVRARVCVCVCENPLATSRDSEALHDASVVFRLCYPF